MCRIPAPWSQASPVKSAQRQSRSSIYVGLNPVVRELDTLKARQARVRDAMISLVTKIPAYRDVHIDEGALHDEDQGYLDASHNIYKPDLFCVDVEDTEDDESSKDRDAGLSE